MMPLRDRFDRSKRKPSTHTQRIGFAFFWLLVLSFAYFISPDANFNTESHLYVAFSIVDHHSVSIDPYHQRLGDEAYYRGHYYSDKAPGLSLLAAPVYAGMRIAFSKKKGLGYEAYSHQRYAIPKDTVYLRYAITYLLVVMPSAIFCVLLWLFLTRILSTRVGTITGQPTTTAGSPEEALRVIPGGGWSLALTVAYALGTITYPYSTWFFSHQIAAILLFSAFLLLFTGIRNRFSDRRLFLRSALAGLLAGYAIISEYPTALIAALLAIYLLAVTPRVAGSWGVPVRALLAFLAGMAPPALLNVGYNLAAFGNPFTAGYMFVHSAMYQNQVHGGAIGMILNTVRAPSLGSLWQITFGTYRGLFDVSPFLLLFFVGLYFMWRRRELRPELWLCVAVVVLYFLMDASRGVDQNGWSGGWSIASRHLTPMLPFMIVPIVFGLASRTFRAAFVALAAISTAIMFAAVASGDQFSFADKNPLINEMLPHFFHGKILVNWGYMLGLTGLPSLLPLLVIALGLVTRIVWLFRGAAQADLPHESPAARIEAS